MLGKYGVTMCKKLAQSQPFTAQKDCLILFQIMLFLRLYNMRYKGINVHSTLYFVTSK